MAIYDAPESLHVGTGTETVFGFNWPYLLPRDLSVTLNGVPVPTVLASTNQVSVTPAPAPGVIVRIYRNTPAQIPTYLFASGIPMLPRYIDGNNKQLLFALQEGLLQFAQTQATADLALLRAELAVRSADSAVATSQQASATARRGFRAAPSDPEPIASPPVAQRRNSVACFDNEGNLIAAAPVSGSAVELGIKLASTDVNEGSANVGRTVRAFDNVAQLLLVAVPRETHLYTCTAFCADGTGLGGMFKWVPTMDRAKHDGVRTISPTVPWNGSPAPEHLGAFWAGVGETAPTARGCFIRLDANGHREVASAGVISADSVNKQFRSLDSGHAIYTGGVVEMPRGVYNMRGRIDMGATSPNSLHSNTMSGQGKQATTLSFAGVPIPAGSAAVTIPGSVFSGIEDLCIRDSLGGGLLLSDAGTWNHIELKRLRISFNQGTGLRGYRGFMSKFEQLFVTHNTVHGIHMDELHTSLHYDNCYSASNGGTNYMLAKHTYSVLTACASDHSGGHGYRISGSSTTMFNGCGAESAQRSAWAAEADTTVGANIWLAVNSLLAFDCNQGGAGWPNAVHVKSTDKQMNTVCVRNARSMAPNKATIDMLVDGEGAYVVDEYNSFPLGVLAANRGYIHHVPYPLVVRDKVVAGATILTTLKSPQGKLQAYGGQIIIQASNKDPSEGGPQNTATYILLVNRGAGGGGTVVELGKSGLVGGLASAHPSFTWEIGTDETLICRPIGATTGTFFFEIQTTGFVKVGTH